MVGSVLINHEDKHGPCILLDVKQGAGGKAEAWPKSLGWRRWASPCPSSAEGRKMQEKQKVMGEAVRNPRPARERREGWDWQETALSGSCWEELWVHLGFGAAGRVRQRAAGAKKQAGVGEGGGSGWSVERRWGGRKAGFGHCPAGKGRSKDAQSTALARLRQREGKREAFPLQWISLCLNR